MRRTRCGRRSVGCYFLSGWGINRPRTGDNNKGREERIFTVYQVHLTPKVHEFPLVLVFEDLLVEHLVVLMKISFKDFVTSFSFINEDRCFRLKWVFLGSFLLSLSWGGQSIFRFLVLKLGTPKGGTFIGDSGRSMRSTSNEGILQHHLASSKSFKATTLGQMIEDLRSPVSSKKGVSNLSMSFLAFEQE